MSSRGGGNDITVNCGGKVGHVGGLIVDIAAVVVQRKGPG